MTAARDGKPVDSQIEMASSEGLNTSDPDYAPPYVGDIQLVYIAWDILFVDEEVCVCAKQACCSGCNSNALQWLLSEHWV